MALDDHRAVAESLVQDIALLKAQEEEVSAAIGATVSARKEADERVATFERIILKQERWGLEDTLFATMDQQLAGLKEEEKAAWISKVTDAKSTRDRLIEEAYASANAASETYARVREQGKEEARKIQALAEELTAFHTGAMKRRRTGQADDKDKDKMEQDSAAPDAANAGTDASDAAKEGEHDDDSMQPEGVKAMVRAIEGTSSSSSGGAAGAAGAPATKLNADSPVVKALAEKLRASQAEKLQLLASSVPVDADEGAKGITKVSFDAAASAKAAADEAAAVEAKASAEGGGGGGQKPRRRATFKMDKDKDKDKR